MMIAPSIGWIGISRSPILEFRRPRVPGGGRPSEKLLDLVENKMPGIRCPLCFWRPTRNDKWTCWDCDYPEYFYDGCGTEWNTFETRGRCPTCAHRWRWTSCLQCWRWSPHEEWYTEDDTT